MRKLMMVVAMLGIVVVAAGPALAQVAEGFSEKSTKSGSASPADKISNSGKNVNLCPTDQQVAQTGNTLNEQGVDQYLAKADDISFSGTDLEITPNVTATCDQTLRQAAAAAPKAAAAAPKAEAKAPEAKAGKAEAQAPAAKAGELPKTGGVAGTASLLGLGAGALLVSGGLLIRRATR